MTLLWPGRESVGCLLDVLFFVVAFSLSTRRTISMTKFVGSGGSSTVRKTTVHTLATSDIFLSNAASSTKNCFVLVLPQGGYVLRVDCLNCRGSCEAVSTSAVYGGLLRSAVGLRSRDVGLTRMVIAKGTTTVRVGKSALRCGANVCTLSSRTSIHSLLGLLPGIAIARRKRVLIRKGPMDGVLISKGSFFSGGPRVTSGSLPNGVISGMRIVSRDSRISQFAKFSGKSGRAMLGLSIGRRGGMNMVTRTTIKNKHSVGSGGAQCRRGTCVGLLGERSVFSLVLQGSGAGDKANDSRAKSGSIKRVKLLVGGRFDGHFGICDGMACASVGSMRGVLASRRAVLSSRSSLFSDSGHLSSAGGGVLSTNVEAR